jgi:hypothetical protein
MGLKLMSNYDIDQLIYGINYSSNQRKQIIGRALAEHLSFIPGPGGKDGSVDGAIMGSDEKLFAHFQSKLSSNSIHLDEAKILHSDLIRLSPHVCVYVAGVGYDDSVYRLLSSQNISQINSIHLLTLKDIFQHSDAYIEALKSLPKHAGGEINWSIFHV